MPRLTIVDQIVSAGGVEHFVQNLIDYASEVLPDQSWEINLLINALSTGDRAVEWPAKVRAKNYSYQHIRADSLSRFMDSIIYKPSILSLPGTGKMLHALPWAMRRLGPRFLRGAAGDRLSWIEHAVDSSLCDIVYFCYPYFMNCPSVSAPLVATFHDFNWKEWDTFDEPTRLKLDTQTPSWLKKSSAIVVSSHSIAADLRRFYPEYANKARVVRLGIPGRFTESSPEDVAATLRRLRVPDRFVLSVGWLVRHKNQMIIFKALRVLRDKGIHLPLVLVGPNTLDLVPVEKGHSNLYADEIAQFAEQNGLQLGADYFVPGYVSDSDLQALYTNATALIAPSFYEAGSFPAREAMRVGCPVIYSRIPSFTEEYDLLEGSAWMFDPRSDGELVEAIEQILRDGEEVDAKRRRAAALVAHVFSWKKTVEGYFSVFDEVIR